TEPPIRIRPTHGLNRSDGAQLRSPALRDRTRKTRTPVPLFSRRVPARPAAATTASHIPLGVFRGMSRRRLAFGTLLLSMFLVVIHDLPASASTLPVAEPPVAGQEPAITDATRAAATRALPLEPAPA